jgi:hypothetical protein
MLLQPVLTDILVKLRVQLHQLTPNAFTQLSKYFWAVISFSGEPSSDSFAKCYELHYQPKKVEVDGGEKFQKFGCLNFHARQGGGVKLTPAIKNKWSTGRTKAWFYYKVSMHVCVQGGKAMHVLRSYMCGLDFRTETPFDRSDDNSGDISFIWATKFVGGRDAIEEFLACDVYPLAAGVSFHRVAVGVTSVSKLKIPLPKYVAARKDNEDDV